MSPPKRPATGLRRFLDMQRQRDWMEGKATLRDTAKRAESLELRLKYLPRYQKLMTLPQARDVLDVLARYGRDCLPIPRTTERAYWSVSCLPATPGKALIRINASWMELFSLHRHEDGIRGTFLLHLSDFTTDHKRFSEFKILRILSASASFSASSSRIVLISSDEMR